METPRHLVSQFAAPCSSRRQPQWRVAIFAVGTRGDFQPVIALALRLQGVGCRVKVISSKLSPLEVANIELLRSFCLDVDSFTSMITAYEKVRDFMPHVLLHQWTMTVVSLVAEEQLGIPVVEYAFWPTPPWTAGDRFKEVIVHKRALDAHLGFETLRGLDEGQVFKELWVRRPVLFAFSGEVVERQFYWPHPSENAGFHTTGYWVLGMDQHQDLLKQGNSFFGGASSPKLTAFLAAGPPPVYMGWGSQTGNKDDGIDQVSLGRLACEALQRASKRGVILGSYSNMDSTVLDSGPHGQELQAYCAANVFWLRWAPHEWLMPRCSAIVHHGGCSTTAASLRAGVPVVVTPFCIDQNFWGDQVSRNGVGVKTAHIRELTATDLADALQVCDSPNIIRRAKEFGHRLSREDGTGRAADWLIRFMHKHNGPLVERELCVPESTLPRTAVLHVAVPDLPDLDRKYVHKGAHGRRPFWVQESGTYRLYRCLGAFWCIGTEYTMHHNEFPMGKIGPLRSAEAVADTVEPDAVSDWMYWPGQAPWTPTSASFVGGN